MIVLHAGVYAGRVLLWGETSAPSEAALPTRRRGRRPEVSHPPSLPYDPEAKGLSAALREAGFRFAADKKRIETAARRAHKGGSKTSARVHQRHAVADGDASLWRWVTSDGVLPSESQGHRFCPEPSCGSGW